MTPNSRIATQLLSVTKSCVESDKQTRPQDI